MARPGSPLYVPPDFGKSSARYAGRPVGFEGDTGILTVSWDLRPIIRLAARMANEFHNADPAIRQAHEEMAQGVQHYAAQALEEAIAHRGPRHIGPREQRGSKLIDALIDDRNRETNISGFSVGYLDRIDTVKLYWRRIEEGSSTQVGDVFYGAFLSRSGKWSWPTGNEAAQVDPKLYKFREVGPLTKGGTFKSHKDRALEGEENTGGRTPIVHITRPIPAYHYLTEGFRKFGVEEGRFSAAGARESVLATYAQAFAEHGMDFLARWGRRYSVAPSAASVAKHYGGG